MISIRLRISLVLTFFYLMTLSAWAQVIEIEDLKYHWNVKADQTNKLEPYFGQSADAVYFNMNTSANAAYHLQLELPTNTFFYINERMRLVSKGSSSHVLSIDSLHHAFGSELNMAVFGRNLDHFKVETKVVQLIPSTQSGHISAMPIFEREKDLSRDRLIILGIMILGLLLGYRTMNYRMFSEYFSPFQTFVLRQRFDVIGAQSTFGFKNLSFIILYGILLGAGVYTLQMTKVEVFTWSSFETAPWLLALLVTFGSVVLIILKYPLLLILSELFKVRKILTLQYMIYCRFSLLVSALFFGTCLVIGLTNKGLWTSLEHILVALGLIILFSRVMMIFLVLNSRLIFYKLHLFTYLCSTEIFPLIVFLKFLL